jgi:hypothetical protein
VNRFGIPNAIRFDTESGGFVLQLFRRWPRKASCIYKGHTSALGASRATARAYCQLQELVRVRQGDSQRSAVIFPWFGPRSDGRPGPAHGFAHPGVDGWKIPGYSTARE